MRQLIHRLASMKIAVTLLVVIMVSLAAGTLAESRSGSEAATRLVYHAIWFRLLLGLFAINVACSLADHWPWGPLRLGFALTHTSMLIVLAGALVTDMLKVEGRLALLEGEESHLFSTPGGNETATAELPFSVRLEAFEIEYYPGTDRPAMFRSRVLVTDLASGGAFPAVIEMNRELSYAGYRLFQSSYKLGSDRDQTVLNVSRDPGQAIVFAGYFVLMAGMVTVLGTRIAQRRSSPASQTVTIRSGGGGREAAILSGFVIASALSGAGLAEAATLPEVPAVEALRRLPVQYDGRVMPFDTLAREATWKVTGERAWRGIDCTALVLGWAFDPEGWAAEPMVPLDGSFASAIGLGGDRRLASFQELLDSPKAMALFDEARAAQQQERPLAPHLRGAQKVEERLTVMHSIMLRKIFRVIPAPGDQRAAWSVPARLQTASDLLAFVDSGQVGAVLQKEKIDSELLYNRLRPSRLSWWILTAAAVASLLGWSLGKRLFKVPAVLGLAAGFAMMTWGLAARWQIAGRIPASDIYESLLFLAWGVALAGLIAFVFLRIGQIVLNATGMAALTMLLADCLPIDPFIHPMPPVLSGTPWLAIHVPIIMVSYSLLALSVAVAHAQIGFQIFAPSRTGVIAKMNDMLYWYIHVGSFLLIVGILTGSIWAASSWGRYWGWDPKEVWSLIAFLAYLAILHGRFDRLIGPFGVAALSIIAFWTILMTYLGVNFVLTTGLHTYGWGSSGVVRWLAIVAGAETLFLTAGLAAYRAGRRLSG